MAINRNGFLETNNNLIIDKDTEAELVYTLDWSQWLTDEDLISTVEFTVAARRNDPAALVIDTSGVTGDSLKTFVELSGGAETKVYIVTAKITTTSGLIDRRNFRVNVVNRSA